MKVFGEAYIAAFTPENNRKAFEKTGVHPLNRSAIDPKDLAPAMEHSVHAHLPLNVPSPVKAMMEVYRNTLYDIQCEKDSANGWETDTEDVNINNGVDDEDEDDDDDGDNEDENGDVDDDDGEAGRRGAGDVQRALLRGTHTPLQSRSPVSPPPSPLRARSTGSTLPPRTPARFRLRSALQKSSPMRALVNGTPSRTPEPVPVRAYLHPTIPVHWNSLPRPATDVYDELEMVRNELSNAKKRDEQSATCLEAAHSQLAIVGCWAETCRNHAVAAKGKRGKKGGRRIQNEGRGRIITDPAFLADIQRADMEEIEAEAAKQARRDARKERGAAAVVEKQYKDARALVWQAVKDTYDLEVTRWVEIGKVGPKPKLAKRKDVWKEYDDQLARDREGAGSSTDAPDGSTLS